MLNSIAWALKAYSFEKMESDDFEFQLLTEKEVQQKSNEQSSQQTSSTYVDSNDGTVYEWDGQRKGWFPKITEDFIAAYQASYGIYEEKASDSSESAKPPESQAVDPSSTNKAPISPQDQSAKRDNTHLDQPDKSKKPKPNEKAAPPTWFDLDIKQNSHVYVSGLPMDITTQDFADLMSKCGIIMVDDDGQPKVRLYKDSEGMLKGDGLCCYLKMESVQLAKQILHESDYRGNTISVQKAHFEQKGEYNPALKKKKNKKKKKKGNAQAKLLDWRERRNDGPRKKKCDRIIVFRRVFDPKEFEEDSTQITEIREDLHEECSKFGTVKKLLLFDRHPEGVVSIAFADFEAADMCVLQMNGRWYRGRQLEVSPWDGLTDFQIEETDQEREQRLEKWEQFLKEEDDSGEVAVTQEESVKKKEADE